MSVSKKTLQKRMSEIQKTLKVFEFLINHSSDSSTLPNEKKPEIESLSVTELCSKYYFVTGGKDDVSLRLNVMNVFKSMLKCEFNKVCDMYLKSLHTLLSSQSSDTFRVTTKDNISYLMIGEQSQFILIPREVDIDNFKQEHKELILEHVCNFYQFSIEKKEQVLQKVLQLQIDKKKTTPKNGRNAMNQSSNNLTDKVASSVLGKRKQCESQTHLVPQEGIMENKPKKKKQQRKPKNKANDAMIDSLLNDEENIPTFAVENEKNPIEPEWTRKGEEEMTTVHPTEHHTKTDLPTDSKQDSTKNHANILDFKGDTTLMDLPKTTPSEINKNANTNLDFVDHSKRNPTEATAADLHTAGDVNLQRDCDKTFNSLDGNSTDEDNSFCDSPQDLYVKNVNDVNTMLGYPQVDDDISYGSFND